MTVQHVKPHSLFDPVHRKLKRAVPFWDHLFDMPLRSRVEELLLQAVEQSRWMSTWDLDDCATALVHLFHSHRRRVCPAPRVQLSASTVWASGVGRKSNESKPDTSTGVSADCPPGNKGPPGRRGPLPS